MRQRTARAILRIIPSHFTLDRRIFYLKRGSKIKLHKEVDFGKSKICIKKMKTKLVEQTEKFLEIVFHLNPQAS